MTEVELCCVHCIAKHKAEMLHNTCVDHWYSEETLFLTDISKSSLSKFIVLDECQVHFIALVNVSTYVSLSKQYS